MPTYSLARPILEVNGTGLGVLSLYSGLSATVGVLRKLRDQYPLEPLIQKLSSSENLSQ